MRLQFLHSLVSGWLGSCFLLFKLVIEFHLVGSIALGWVLKILVWISPFTLGWSWKIPWLLRIVMVNGGVINCVREMRKFSFLILSEVCWDTLGNPIPLNLLGNISLVKGRYSRWLVNRLPIHWCLVMPLVFSQT